MNYEIIETEFMGQTQQHVILHRADGSFESFPVDEENPRYQSFVEQLEGNEPETINEVE